MTQRLSVLMTVYNEAEFVDYAIRACLPHVDDLVIVEGAYQETIDLGAEPRSTDGTIDIVEMWGNLQSTEAEPGKEVKGNVHLIYANEKTDKDQRNVGLEKIKELNPEGWLLIIDGDEVYDSNNFAMIKSSMVNMERSKKLAAIFKSLTFVNDLKHYTEQDFPRLFRITPDCKFVNDNFMEWSDLKIGWFSPFVIRLPYIRYCHYSFCKGERINLKKDWWESRFDDNYRETGEKFEYDWHQDENNNWYSPNHEIYEYTGEHPKIIRDHPLWEKSYLKKK